MKKNYLGRAWRCLLLLLLLPAVSKAFDPGQVYALINYGTGQSIEIGAGNSYQPGHQANLWGYWGGAHQQWRIEVVSYAQYGLPDRYHIVNRNSNQVLEINAARNCGFGCGGAVASQNFAQTVGSSPGDPAQLWNYTYDSNRDAYQFQLMQNGQLLTAGPNNSVIQDYSYGTGVSGDTQYWQVVKVSANPYYDTNQGVYQIINVHSGKALTASLDDKHVSQVTNWGLANGQWTFTAAPTATTVHIKNRSTGMILEIGGGNTAPGSTTNVWDDYGHPWQEWVLADAHTNAALTPAQASAGNIRCKIYSIHAGKVLEIGGGGSQLYQEDRAATLYYDYSWDDSGNDKQQWYVQYVSANRTTSTPPKGASTTSAEALSSEKMTSSNATKAEGQAFSLYPNPALDLLTLNMDELGDVSSVKVTDMRGATTAARYLSNGQVNVADLAPGLYLVTVSANGREYRQKFAKK